MELPGALRKAVEEAMEGVALAELRRAAEMLSRRYRKEIRDGRLHVGDRLAAQAYLATRLPATYAAIRAALGAVAEARPDFAPASMIDVGAGPGSAAWAAHDAFGGLRRSTLVEASAAMRSMGERLAARLPVQVSWMSADATVGLPDLPEADLVTLAYVLDELPPAGRIPLIEKLWSRTADTLVVVEPGTPTGWQRILEVRAALVASGGHLVAPCPHQAACPVAAPDWCHFARRLARSRLHRLAKNGDAPFEDEKFAYVAVSRFVAVKPVARVIAPPRAAGGTVRLKLCREDGTTAEELVSRRDGDRFKSARRLAWGDARRR